MNAGEVIQEVGGLNHDRLTYFVRAGYVKPKKIKRGSLYYNDFSPRDLEIIKTAWEGMHRDDYGKKTYNINM